MVQTRRKLLVPAFGADKPYNISGPSQPATPQTTPDKPGQAGPDKPAQTTPDKPAQGQQPAAAGAAKPATPGSQAEALAARIKDEKDLAAY